MFIILPLSSYIYLYKILHLYVDVHARQIKNLIFIVQIYSKKKKNGKKGV